MDLRGQRRSENIEDRRGRGGAAGPVAGLGLGGVVIVGLLLTFFPDARPFILQVLGESPGVTQGQPVEPGAPADEAGDFVAAVLGSVEDVWSERVAAGDLAALGVNPPYRGATLVLFSGSVDSACGFASAAVGPFYCPQDERVYLDVSFFQDMERQLGATGDFAHAYVVAHEVGHHLQRLTGATDRVQAARGALPAREANQLSVRLELQADCYAGVWGHHSGRRGQLSQGDIEEALGAAAAIGDDRLQRQAGRAVVPDSFTHGSSEQRVRWFRRGFDTGDPAQCDTFAAEAL